MEHLAVAYALGMKSLSGREGDAVAAPQHPPTVSFALVSEAFASVAQHLGQQLGQGHLLGEGHVDPPLRRTDRHAGQTDAHQAILPFVHSQ
ncbi:hypothetical protein Ait01nite_072270 [Actinoplanes italicus]|nr:hypothetical protein Ait01nite_072270 [Actinoplanes italicus]